MSTCPKCGQQLPEPDLIKGVHVRGMKRRILEIVHHAGARGISSEAIFTRLYDGDPNGGPLTGVKIIAVHCVFLNRLLKPHGLMIRASRGRSPDNHYYLRKLA